MLEISSEFKICYKATITKPLQKWIIDRYTDQCNSIKRLKTKNKTVQKNLNKQTYMDN